MRKHVLLIQIDGALPNMALMRLSAWHRARGASVSLIRPPKPSSSKKHDDDLFNKSILPDIFRGLPNEVYASTIFSKSADRTAAVRRVWPNAVIGGTGLPNSGQGITLESIGVKNPDMLDYIGYPDFKASIGFTQRGCRLKCKWCVVPGKEGANTSTHSVYEIWRGPDYPKHIHLLDNDFFGQEHWRERCDEIRHRKFSVCFSQGINIRLFNDQQAYVLSQIDYRDGRFKRKRIYTAWDNLGHEKLFFAGIERLTANGILPAHIMVYMLIGFDPKETEQDILYRIGKLKDAGLLPYPMPYIAPGADPDSDPKYLHLRKIQRWVIKRLYEFVPWEDYNRKPDRYLPLVDDSQQDGWLHENH